MTLIKYLGREISKIDERLEIFLKDIKKYVLSDTGFCEWVMFDTRGRKDCVCEDVYDGMPYVVFKKDDYYVIQVIYIIQRRK